MVLRRLPARGPRRRALVLTVREGEKASAWEEVYGWVRRIPPGRVMSYGQIAKLLRRPLSARAVGWAMRQCPEDAPWHRVVNALGGMSTERLAHLPDGLQRHLLEGEGVRFRDDGTLPMTRYRWPPVPARPRKARKK